MGGSNACTDCNLICFCCNDKYDNEIFHKTLKDFNIEWMALCIDEESKSCMSEWYYTKTKAYINEMNRYKNKNNYIYVFEKELEYYETNK